MGAGLKSLSAPPKRQAGDSVWADEWNQIVDCVAAVDALGGGGGIRIAVGGSMVRQAPLSTRFPACSVLIRNDGDDVRPFGPMKITGQMFSDDNGIQSRAVMIGRGPESGDGGGLFVVVQRGIPEGAIGWAWSSGIFPAWIRSTSAADPTPERCDIDPDYSAALMPIAAGAAELIAPRSISADAVTMGLVRI